MDSETHNGQGSRCTCQLCVPVWGLVGDAFEPLPAQELDEDTVYRTESDSLVQTPELIGAAA